MTQAKTSSKDRENQILERIKKKGSVPIQQLAEALSVSTMTVHRDLNRLEEKGLIRKDLTPGIMKRAFFGALDEMARYWVLSTQKKHNINEAAMQISSVFIRGMMSEEAWKNYQAAI